MIKVLLLTSHTLYLSTDCFKADDYVKDYCLSQVIAMWKQQVQALMMMSR